MTWEPSVAEQSKLAVYLHGKNARVQIFQESDLYIFYSERPFYPLFTWVGAIWTLPIILTRI